ncbi:OLC1v1011635C2 [Oldenlandia corymbosa var. corymbosa]|uniref:OLC1v1011635C2 n=1 Tax=Oldenlandia corymbosa var. corymbosa TaxID=529605 RepID=A0AAV1DUA6_OLDCO|nr:OLC1v1011635C2 [Oldenlandia corymbosa var. corymbosa]
MEKLELNSFEQTPEMLLPDTHSWGVYCDNPQNQETEEVSTKEALADSMVCDEGSRLVPKGFTKPNCTEQIVIFISAGAEASAELDSNVNLLADGYFQGGDTFQTEDYINEGGDYPFIYQSARLGNFSYCINNLPPGDYCIDLHFVEIINVSGPKGMRVFNVFMQDEKVLSDFDIFSIVGANKPLQLVDANVSIKEDEPLIIRFEGVIGSPILSGICVRKASISGSRGKRKYLTCSNCCSEIEVPSEQEKVRHMKSTAKYEEKIKELTESLQRKTEECYQSWMSWTSSNEQLERVRMELDNKTYKTYSLDQSLEKQTERLNNVSNKYEHKRKFWTSAIHELDQKVQKMKEEQIKLSREAHECVDGIPELNKMVFAVQALVEQCEDLKVKYNDEQVKRRKLFNQVQEAKGNIRVFCRCRPLSKAETLAGCSMVVDFDTAKDGELGIQNSGSTKKTFKFDRVYTPKDDQVDVFADTSPMVTSVLDGYNVCIFAYGQTGTGKTFTMEGTVAERGVNYRTLEELFKISRERSETSKYNISVSVLEVYNEQIRDLLDTSSSSKKLEIKQAPEGFHHIPGLVEAEVKNIDQVWAVLQTGSSARAVGSNNVNEHSSRSHCILCVTVKAENLINGERTKSKLWLVDLAGSERLGKTDAQGDRLKEAQNINKSLSALGDVISALANKSGHIPFRNSKLTHLLQDSLGGDSKTLMFVQISPSEKDLSETLSSLNFATRVRGVELGPVRKQIDTSELQKMKLMLDKVKQESKSKDESIKKLDESLQNLESKARGKDATFKILQDKIKDLESQLESKSFSQLQSEKQVSHLSDILKGKDQICASLQEKVLELEKKQRELQSASYEKKVIELEMKLKEQQEESELHSSILQEKVEELENRLRKGVEQNPEAALLHQKIKELEDKIKEQEQQLSCSIVADTSVVNSTKSTPLERKYFGRDEIMNDSERGILRNSNTFNQTLSQGPPTSSVKVESSLQNVRRKRLSRNGEENTASAAAVSSDKKSRQSDPPKPFCRISRATTTKPVINAQRRPVQGKTNRDAVHGVKEKENKKRIWS